MDHELKKEAPAMSTGHLGVSNDVDTERSEPPLLRYRLITGTDDAQFCARVSALLEQGYELQGPSGLAIDGTTVRVWQALVLGPSKV